jgi:hypothetical protein
LRSVTSTGAGVYDWPDAVGMKRVATAFFGLVIFLAVSPLLGMVPSAALFVVLFLYGLMGRPLVPTLVTAAVTAGMIYAIFVRWLDVNLPTGYFGI